MFEGAMRTALIHLVNLLVALLPTTRLFSVKRWLWRACGVEVHEGVCVNSGARIYGTGLVTIGANTWVGIDCTFVVPFGASVCIGAQCDIAPDVLFECGSHRIGGPERRAGEGYSCPISVGAGSWIGARVVLLGGAEIGPGSLIAAGAVVLAGVYPAQALLAGVPARVVREFSDEKGTADV